jgi:putative RecB family exonuclease
VTTEAERLIEVKQQPRSVSQVQQYNKCAYSYYLGRIARDPAGNKIWDRPAAWLPMGTAVHAAAEALERSDRHMPLEGMLDVYSVVYAESTNELLETSTMDTWFSSGTYRGEQDIERRHGLGLAQTEKYFDYYTAGKGASDVVWVADDGTPGIELGFEIDLDGVAVRGYIDTVFNTPKGVVVNDNKTGVKPGDVFQLATYGVAMREQYDTAVNHGQFWMGRKGKPEGLIDLFTMGRSEISDAFHELDEAVKAEKFNPSPDPEKCGRCGFNSYCPFVAIR